MNKEEASVNLQGAIEAWAEAHGVVPNGSVVADWIIVGTSQWFDRPGRTLYWQGFRGGSQAPHITAGLLHYGQITNDRDIWQPGEDEDDEDSD